MQCCAIAAGDPAPIIVRRGNVTVQPQRQRPAQGPADVTVSDWLEPQQQAQQVEQAQALRHAAAARHIGQLSTQQQQSSPVAPPAYEDLFSKHDKQLHAARLRVQPGASATATSTAAPRAPATEEAARLDVAAHAMRSYHNRSLETLTNAYSGNSADTAGTRTLGAQAQAQPPQNECMARVRGLFGVLFESLEGASLVFFWSLCWVRLCDCAVGCTGFTFKGYAHYILTRLHSGSQRCILTIHPHAITATGTCPRCRCRKAQGAGEQGAGGPDVRRGGGRARRHAGTEYETKRCAQAANHGNRRPVP